MQFSLMPLLEDMLQLYQIAPGPQRFAAYLALLHGDSQDDLVRPIGGYNPMAKPHVAAQIADLQALGAEALASAALDRVNKAWAHLHPHRHLQMGLVLADDLKGGWTFRHTTDYDSTFRLNALETRDLAATYLWTSEGYSAAQLQHQVAAYALRTVHWLDHPKPATLAEHIAQEQFVARHNPFSPILEPLAQPDLVAEIIETFGESADYLLILNVLYGDAAVEAIGHPAQGIAEPLAGYRWATFHAG